MYVYFCLVVGSVIGVFAVSVCASLDGWVFSVVYYLMRAGARFYCVQFIFGLVLDTLAHSSYCHCLSLLRSRSSGFRGEYHR